MQSSDTREKIANILELRRKLRSGIMDTSFNVFLKMPAVKDKEIAEASKILLENHQRVRETDTAMNMAIATAAIIASKNPDQSTRLGDFYAEYAIDKTIVRIALLDKLKDADSELALRMAEVMRSKEIERSQKLLEENALLKKENEKHRLREAEMEKLAFKKAAEILADILPFSRETQEKIKERILN